MYQRDRTTDAGCRILADLLSWQGALLQGAAGRRGLEDPARRWSELGRFPSGRVLDLRFGKTLKQTASHRPPKPGGCGRGRIQQGVSENSEAG